MVPRSQSPLATLSGERPVREVATVHRHHCSRFLSTAQLALLQGEYELAAVLSESAAALARGAAALMPLEDAENRVAALRSLAGIGRKPKPRSCLSIAALEELGSELESLTA